MVCLAQSCVCRSCFVLRRLVLPRLVVSCLVASCRFLSRGLVLSCPVLPRSALGFFCLALCGRTFLRSASKLRFFCVAQLSVTTAFFSKVVKAYFFKNSSLLKTVLLKNFLLLFFCSSKFLQKFCLLLLCLATTRLVLPCLVLLAWFGALASIADGCANFSFGCWPFACCTRPVANLLA